MRFVIAVFASIVAVLFFNGCTVPSNTPKPHVYKSPQSAGQQEPSRLESIAYDWESNRLRVNFYRAAPDGLWTVTVRDAWDVFEQSNTAESKVWGTQESRCSLDQCVQIIDRSLATFHAERPDAKLESLHVEMQVIKNLWSEILASLNRRLSAVNGEKTSSRVDTPDDVSDEIRLLLERSPSITQIKTLLRNRGIHVPAVYISQEIMFKDSLAGRKWSDIATLPGVGILLPGVLEFDLAESRIKSAQENNMNQPTVSPSQSAQR